MHSQTDRKMISKVLRHLEEKGLIRHQDHATDSRAKVIFLTQEGHALVQKAIQIVEQTDLKFFTAPEERQPTFSRAIHLLIRENEA